MKARVWRTARSPMGARRQDQRADRDRGLGRRSLRKAAVDSAATREEILETLGMASYMGAGPSAIYASHARGAYAGFAIT